MDFLFENPLANMPGVLFLCFYAVFSLLAIVSFYFWKQQNDKTDQLALPPIPPDVDPHEIAFLRGGINELARSVTFSLRQNDLLILETDGKTSRIHPNKHQNNTEKLSHIERSALDWFTVSREPKEIFSSGGLKDVLNPYAQMYEARLKQRKFIVRHADDGAEPSGKTRSACAHHRSGRL